MITLAACRNQLDHNLQADWLLSQQFSKLSFSLSVQAPYLSDHTHFISLRYLVLYWHLNADLVYSFNMM